jgi:hypothetical protein
METCVKCGRRIGLNGLPEGVGATAVPGAKPGKPLWSLYAPWWALTVPYSWRFFGIGPKTIYGAPAWGPTTNGLWVRPEPTGGLFGPLGGMPWVWYPSPGSSMLIHGRLVASGPIPKSGVVTQTLPGYWVSGGGLTPNAPPPPDPAYNPS